MIYEMILLKPILQCQQLLLAFNTVDCFMVSLKHVHAREPASLHYKEYDPFFQATLFERAALTCKMIYQFRPNN